MQEGPAPQQQIADPFANEPKRHPAMVVYTRLHSQVTGVNLHLRPRTHPAACGAVSQYDLTALHVMHACSADPNAVHALVLVFLRWSCCRVSCCQGQASMCA